MTHDEPEIEATRMNQEALQDVRVAAQMGAPHPARVVEMRKRAFDPFAALGRIRRRPRRPRIRRRLPYTGARASGSFDQSRRPLSGSDT